ncbi:Phospholipase/lecithinase/hemolysin [Pseudomonas chlororaphis subsp. aureofaciens]|nr:Phospholipase/lecithinase/hemolysin [Pseudomonas chlororaphis subsp. aureofaciens]
MGVFMIKKTLFVPLAGSLLSLACAQAIATPAPYSNFIVFGDSLSSSGQVADPGGPAGSSYRATNRTGPVYLDGSGEEYSAVAPQLLGARLGFSADQLAGSTSAARVSEGLPDGDNWAVGGYRTDQILDSITTTSVVGDRSRPGYLTMALNSLPDNRYTLEGYTPQTNLNRLNLGVSHKLTQDLALRASYNIRKDDDFTQ